MVGRRQKEIRLPSRLYCKRGAKKTLYYTLTRGNKYIGLGHDLIAAKRKLLDLEGDSPGAGTVGEAIDDMIAEAARLVATGKRGPRYLDDCQDYAVNLKKAFGAMQADAIKPKHIWHYLHKARGVAAPVRANKEVSFLQVVLGRACSQGIIDVNPCIGVERNPETPRDRNPTFAELQAFCTVAETVGHAGKRAALAAMLAFLTGKAQAQILRLSVKQLTTDGIEFLTGRKGGAKTLCQWTPALRETVDASLAMPATITPMYVVHNRDGSPYTRSGFNSGWRDCMAAWKAQGGEPFTFHDLRAGATTDLIEQGRKASEVTGHKLEATVTRIYDRRRVRKANAVR